MQTEKSVFKKILKTPALQSLAIAGALLAPLLVLDLTLSGCANDCDGCGGCDEESSCPSACSAATTQEQCLQSLRSSNPVAPSSCCQPTTISGCTNYAPSQDPACFTAAPANPPADMLGAAGAVSAASANLATAQAALEEAEKLDDPKPEVSAAPLADAAQSAAASDAGQVKDLSLGNVGVPKLGGLNAGVGPAGGTGKSDGGTLSNGPGSSSLGALGGTTAETSPTESETAGAAKTAQAGIGAYASARSGGAGLGSVDSGPSFGSGGGGEGGTAESLSFGSANQTGSGEATPTDSETPEDYLARIPLNDSLFKRVEKKLQEKERYWSPSNPANRLK